MNNNTNSALARSIRMIARNKRVAKTFNNLQNGDHTAVRRLTHEWALSIGLHKDLADELASKLDIKTAAEFQKNIQVVVDTISKRLSPLTPFAIISEAGIPNPIYNHYPVGKRPVKMKSSAWLSAVVERTLEKKGLVPAAYIPFKRGETLARRPFFQALDSNIRTFVHVDDAIYSGAQKGLLVSDMSILLGEYARKFNHLLDVTLEMGAAFSTHRGHQHVLQELQSFSLDKYYTMKCNFVVGGWIMLPKFSKRLIYALKLARVRYDENKPFTILPHKVPDEVSFSPGLLSNYISHTRTPAYKEIQTFI